MGLICYVATSREPTPAEEWAQARGLFECPWKRRSQWHRVRWIAKQGRRPAVQRRAIEIRYKGRHDRWTR